MWFPDQDFYRSTNTVIVPASPEEEEEIKGFGRDWKMKAFGAQRKEKDEEKDKIK